MALSYRTRRRLSVLILVVALPAYIVAAVTLTGWIGDRYGRLPVLAELAVYVILGFLWALPFRFVFRGIGRPDPATRTERPEDHSA
ncbi:MAG: DUF2842 domain-containing protein [Albidovulum sp.]